MAQRTVNIGSSANKGDGDPLRTAFTKINQNFTEVYADIAALEDGGISSDIVGSVFAQDSTLLVDATSASIPAANLTGALPAIDGSNLTGITTVGVAFANVSGTPTTIAGYGITDAFDGQYSSLVNTPTTLDGYGITDAQVAGAPLVGDLTGSVFADDSTLLVDAVNGIITANVQGTVTGDVVGSVFADDSTLLVDGVNAKIPSANLDGALPTIEADNITVNGTSIQTTINNISAALAIGLS